jgi:acetoacetyl-CoA synthetase
VTATDPAPIWTPPAELREHSEMAAWLRDLNLPDYDALWRWSVEDIGRFWRRVWDRDGVIADGDPSVGLLDARVPGARWFPNVSLSYPEHIFRGKRDDAPAVHFASEATGTATWNWAQLSGRDG